MEMIADSWIQKLTSSMANIARPRSDSLNDPNDIHEESLQKEQNPDELIVDWPEVQEGSDASPHPVRRQSKKETLKVKKQVRFAESAILRVYANDPSYAQNKSYSKAEREVFGIKTLSDALRVRQALAESFEVCHGLRPSSSEDQMVSLLGSCGIACEELVGIESLALEKSPTNLVERKRFHTKVVLLEQEKQVTRGYSDANRIARVSMMLGQKSAVQARRRAAMAA